jgi:hypothetical protein
MVEALVAFGETTKYACNVNRTTLEAMRPLATPRLVVFVRGDQSFVAHNGPKEALGPPVDRKLSTRTSNSSTGAVHLVTHRCFRVAAWSG